MKHLLPYSFRQIQFIFWVTLFIFCIMGFLCIRGDAETVQIMKVYEMILLPFTACWVICGFWDYIDAEAREVFLSYPKSRVRMGGVKVFYFMLVFLLFYAVLFFSTFGLEFENIFCFIGMCAEVFFWNFVGFFMIMEIRNVGIALAVVWGYTAIQVLDVEKMFSFMSIYMYDLDSLQGIRNKSIILLVLGSACAFGGQRKMNHLHLGAAQ